MINAKKGADGVGIFTKLPAFLAACRDILENGFFAEINFTVRTLDNGEVNFCTISAKGFVPSNDEFRANGCGKIINPDEIIAKCRKVAERREIKKLEAKIETRDWPLWDSEGEYVIGSKGQKTDLSLMVLFAT